MCRDLFHIGPVPIHSYGVLLAIGFLVAYWMLSRRSEAYGLPRDRMSDVALWALVGGIIGARFFFVVQEWHTFADKPWYSVFNIMEGGMTSYGGYAFGFLTVWFWSRRTKLPLLVLLDALTIPVLVASAIGRIGCFLNGCCFGSECDLPWAVVTHDDLGNTYYGHPAQLYDTGFLLLSALFLKVFETSYLRKPIRGSMVAGFLILYGASRFIFEFFRAGYSSHSSIEGFFLTDAQIVAGAMVICGFVWLVYLLKSRPEPHESATP